MSQEYETKLKAAIEAFRYLREEAALAHLGKIADMAEAHADEKTVVNALCQVIRMARDQDRLAPQVATLQRLHTLYKGNPRYDFAGARVLWYHKWVAENLVEHADVSREMIDGMFQRMDALFISENRGLRPSHMLRCKTAWMMGRDDEAQVHFDRWQETPAGKSDDCAACEVNAKVEFLLALQQIPKAMQAAEPLMKGEMHCDEVPAITFSRLMVVAMNNRQERLAEAMHRSTLRKVRRKADLLACLARHIVYRSLTGRAQSSRRLVALALSRAPRVSDYNRFGAFLSGALWFSILAREGVESVKLPRAFVLAVSERRVGTPEGAAWCLQETRKLGARFDSRNGTALFAKRIEESENLIRMICRSE